MKSFFILFSFLIFICNAKAAGIFNCAIKEGTGGEKYISDANERTLERLIDEFPGKYAGVNIYIITPCNHSTKIADGIISGWYKNHANEKAILLYLNPLEGSNWEEHVKVGMTVPAAKILPEGQLTRIKKNIMVAALEEKEVTFMDPIMGFSKATYGERVKYYMALKLAITELASVINPPPLKLVGINYNGKIYKDGDVILVCDELIKSGISLKPVESYGRDFEIGQIGGDNLSFSNFSTEAVFMSKTFTAAGGSEVSMSYVGGNTSQEIKVKIFSISLSVEKPSKINLYEEISTPIPLDIKISPSIINVRMTLAGPSGSISKVVPSGKMNLYPYSSLLDSTGVPLKGGEYSIVYQPIMFDDTTLRCINAKDKIKIIPKCTDLHLTAVDINNSNRKISEGDTLYIIDDAQRNYKDLGVKLFGSTNTKVPWPSDPFWSLKKGSGETIAIDNKTTFDKLTSQYTRKDSTWIIKFPYIPPIEGGKIIKTFNFNGCKLSEPVTIIFENGAKKKLSTGIKGDPFGNTKEKFKMFSNTLKNILNKIPGSKIDENGGSSGALAFSLKFDGGAEWYNKEDPLSSKYIEVQNWKLGADASIGGEFSLPPPYSFSFPAGSAKPIFTLGAFIGGATKLGLSATGVVEKKYKEKSAKFIKDIYRVELTGELKVGAKMELNTSVVKSNAKAYGQVGMIIRQEANHNKESNETEYSAQILTQPVVARFEGEVSVKSETFDYTVASFAYTYEILPSVSTEKMPLNK